jgi:hypothetical protein
MQASLHREEAMVEALVSRLPGRAGDLVANMKYPLHISRQSSVCCQLGSRVENPRAALLG